MQGLLGLFCEEELLRGQLVFGLFEEGLLLADELLCGFSNVLTFFFGVFALFASTTDSGLEVGQLLFELVDSGL